MDGSNAYFDSLAEMGFTKHMGGMASTRELLEECHVDGNQHMLDVGCGVGTIPVHIAKTYGCRVVGVNVTAGMILRCKERAHREGVEALTEFRVADARDLPFENSTFDVVICESVVAFVAEKQKAVNEFVRVAKPEGYVGLNESTWVKQPPQKMTDYFARALGQNMQTLSEESWERLLTDAGLSEIAADAHSVTYRGEARNRLQRMGWAEMGRVFGRFFGIALTKPEYRQFLTDALSDPRGVIDSLGYGIYVGRK